MNPRRRALAVTAAVSVLLLLPVPGGLSELARGELFRIGKDKIAHAVLFAALGRAWIAALEPHRSRGAAVLFAALVGWGGMIELAQGLTGWRSAEASDLLADALGVALGFAFGLVRRRAEGGTESSRAL